MLKKTTILLIFILSTACGISENDVQATIASLPTQTQPPTATRTPRPTATKRPTDTAQEYLSKKLESIQSLVANLAYYGKLSDQVSNDVSLLFDDTWKFNMVNALAALRFRADELQDRNGYTETYAEFQSFLDLAAGQINLIVSETLILVDERDASRAERIGQSVTNLSDYILAAIESVPGN
jgi:hypothetical protein